MNSWNMIGRLGKEPELKFSGKGEPILGFTLALDTGWGDNKKTLWVKCTGFGKRFEKLAEMISKGSQVGVSGEITSDHWVGKDGNKVPQLEVRINDITLLQGRSGESNSAPRQSKPESSGDFADMTEDVPF